MKWLVISPNYEVIEPILDDGTGPTEITCDVVEVEAESKAEAIVKGIREMRRTMRDGWHNSDPEVNPFRGMKAELVESEEALGEEVTLEAD